METLRRENDALLVDDLLDFSCGDIGEGDDCVVTCICEKEKDSSFLQNSAAISSLEGNIVRPADCLYSPADELYTAEWEWLSSFVEESYKGADNSLPLVSSDEWFSTGGRKEGCFIRRAGDGKRATSWLRMGASSQILDVGSSPLIEMSASCWPPASRSERSRSKRSCRSRGRVWSLQTVRRPPLPTHTYKTSTHEEDEDNDDDDQETSSLDYEPYRLIYCKKAKKGNACNAEEEEEGRRCSHCQVQKTPQWRTGPLGPKTLCNACGVRYKSGRLLPEYRPAASPTFISQLHSNSHKKVLEMRTFKSQELDQDEFSSCSQESITSLHH